MIFILFKIILLLNSGSVSSEKVLALEQKIYKNQEELTKLHRTKGEVNKYITILFLKLIVIFTNWCCQWCILLTLYDNYYSYIGF